MTNLWSGRFDIAPDAAAFEFGASFRFDRRLFEDDVTGSIAWGRALAKAGVLSADEAGQIEQTLSAILEHGRSDPSFVDGADEDVHSFVERQLVERVGDTGRRLHTGRSRNEQVSLDLRLYLRRRIPVLQKLVAAVVEALASQAAAAGDALMPSFTHFRPAQPVLVAHFFLSHAAPLRRDLPASPRPATRRMPVRSAAARSPERPMPSTSRRSLAIWASRASSTTAWMRRRTATLRRRFSTPARMTQVHLSRLAEDLIIFCGDEHHFFELSDALSTGSSMMPQKKNPDPLELVRGKTGRSIGHLVGMLTTIKGLPTGYNKDLQEDKEAVFGAEDTLAGCLAVVRCRGRWSDAQSCARAAARLGHAARDRRRRLSGRPGHAVPPRPRSRRCARPQADRRAAVISNRSSLEEWRAASDLFEADIVARITPAVSVTAKRTPQSTSPDAVGAPSWRTCGAWLDGSAGLC